MPGEKSARVPHGSRRETPRAGDPPLPQSAAPGLDSPVITQLICRLWQLTAKRAGHKQRIVDGAAEYLAARRTGRGDAGTTSGHHRHEQEPCLSITSPPGQEELLLGGPPVTSRSAFLDDQAAPHLGKPHLVAAWAALAGVDAAVVPFTARPKGELPASARSWRRSGPAPRRGPEVVHHAPRAQWPGHVREGIPP